MIGKNKYYNNYELPDSKTQKRMWKSVQNEIKGDKRKLLPDIEFRSFSFGMAAAVIVFFTFVGIKAVLSNFIESKQPISQRVNEVYLDAINSFERKMPLILANKESSIKLDDLISVRQEQLRTIDEAITEFKKDEKESDQSPMKLRRLTELYKMKLDLLNEIIAMEDNRK